MSENVFSEPTLKAAVVDIGANSVRMNVYDINIKTGRFFVCDSARSMLGLAAYASGGRLSAEGEGKLFSVLREYLARAGSIPADSFSAFATASLRGLENADKVVSSIKNRLGVNIRIIGGDEEAALDFEATLSHFAGTLSSRGVVIDMGGGSTELIGFENGEKKYAVSLPIGCLALSKKYVKTPPRVSVSERENIIKYVGSTLSAHSALRGFGGTAYLIGGTARASARIFMGTTGSSGQTDGFCFSNDDFFYVVGAVSAPAGGTLVKRFASDRTVTAAPGIIALGEIVRFIGADKLTVSGAGVREGYLLGMIKNLQMQQ